MQSESTRPDRTAIEQTRAYREAVARSPFIGFPVTELDATRGDRLISVSNDLEGITYRYTLDGQDHEEVIPTFRTQTPSVFNNAAIMQINQGGMPPKLVLIGGGTTRPMKSEEHGVTVDLRTYRHMPAGQVGIVPVTELSLYVLPRGFQQPGHLILVHENVGAARVLQTEPAAFGIQPSWFPGINVMDENGVRTIGETGEYLHFPEGRLFTPFPFPNTSRVEAKMEPFGVRRAVPCLTLTPSA